MENFIWTSSSSEQRAQSHMRGPGESRATQDRYGHEGGFAASPSGGLAEKDHGEIEAPGDERKCDAWIADPGGAGVDERPGAARDNSERDKDEAEAHGVGDEIVECRQRRKAPEKLR